MKPRYAQLAAERGIGEEVRYMQPPPFAVFLTPLALMSYHTAYVVWNLVLMLCAFGVCWQAGRIFTICLGREHHLAGILLLLMATSPECHRWIRVQNMSAVVGLLIGFAALDLVGPYATRRSWRGAIAIWFAGIAKYAGFALVPLYFATRKWTALLMVIGLTIGIYAVSFAVMGRGVFDEFAHKIAPTLGRSTTLSGSQCIQSFILRVTHRLTVPRGAAITLGVVQAVFLGVILTPLLKRPRAFWTRPANVFAAALALVMWMLLFSPIYWEHYICYVAPFWGWLVWEAMQGPVRRWLVVASLVMCYIPLAILPRNLIIVPDPIVSHFLWASLLMFGIALWRLFQTRDENAVAQ